MQNSYYTYAHYTKDTNELFYIGMGKGRRLTAKEGRNKHWTNKVLKHGFTAVKLAEWKTKEEAAQHEILLIASFRDLNFNLVNKSSGGEYSALGFKHTEETKKLFSEQRKGKKFSLGYKHSEETRKRMSEAQQNKKHNPETIKRLSELNAGVNNKMYGKPAPTRKKVYCITTDKYFDCIQHAAQEYGVDNAKITLVCQGKRKHTKGYEFRYV